MFKSIWNEFKSWFKSQPQPQKNTRECSRCFDRLNDTVWEVDTQLNITSINKAIEKYGWTKNELIGKSLTKICPPETMQLCFNVVAKYHKDPKRFGKQRFKVICNYKDRSKPYNVEVNVSVMKDKNGVVVGYSGVSRNIDGQIEVEALKKENGLFRGIFSFCSGICNELTQPLQSIIGYISIIKLLDLNDKKDQEELMEIINKILNQISRVTDLIKNLQSAKNDQFGENFVNEILEEYRKHP